MILLLYWYVYNMYYLHKTPTGDPSEKLQSMSKRLGDPKLHHSHKHEDNTHCDNPALNLQIDEDVDNYKENLYPNYLSGIDEEEF